MAIVGILLWWYVDGFRQAARRVRAHLAGMFDYFSVDLLLKSLFSPFRQISAGAVDGPLPVKLRAFGDRLFSRVIGAVVRTMVITVGVITLTFSLLGGLLYLVGWILMPLVPLLGLIMTMIGWTPWQMS